MLYETRHYPTEIFHLVFCNQRKIFSIKFISAVALFIFALVKGKV